MTPAVFPLPVGSPGATGKRSLAERTKLVRRPSGRSRVRIRPRLCVAMRTWPAAKQAPWPAPHKRVPWVWSEATRPDEARGDPLDHLEAGASEGRPEGAGGEEVATVGCSEARRRSHACRRR